MHDCIRAELLTPSCREGVSVLRGLAHGLIVRLSQEGWQFEDAGLPKGFMKALPLAQTWPRGPLDPTWIEWTLEGGYTQRVDGNRQLVLTACGREYLRALDFSARYCVASSCDVKMDGLFERIEDIKARHPDDDYFVVAQILAQVVLSNVFGFPWLERHLTNPRTAAPFFGGDGHDDRIRTQGMHRLVLLAEMILNMRLVPGLTSSIKRVAEGDIESGFAEIEVGRLLHVAGAAYRFVVPKRRKGDDYDLELLISGRRICAETKCKLETTPMSVNGVVDALRVARRQMPDSSPGMAFVKVPESWDVIKNDEAFLRFTKEVADRFFHGYGKYRGTEHVVSVKFHSNTLADVGDVYRPLLTLSEFANPRHRWGDSVDWAIFDRIHVDAWPGKWVQLLQVC